MSDIECKNLTTCELSCEQVSFGYSAKAFPLFTDVGFKIGTKAILSLLGPNGSGKSTLISLLVGLMQPICGCVKIAGKSTESWTAAELAGVIACVPQDHHPVFRFTVREMLLMGRSPHLGILGLPSNDDFQKISSIAQMLALTEMLDIPYTDLSGGEIKRVLLARAFVQDTPILVLDEPDAHLDMPTQLRFLRMVREWVNAGERLAVFSTHNPDLALRFSTHCLLIPGHNKPVVFGSTPNTINKANLEALYGLSVEELRSSKGESVMHFSI